MRRFDNVYFENYAMLTIEYFCPELKGHFCRSDKPDLQNEIDSISIEVTSSESERSRKVNAFAQSKLIGKKPSVSETESFWGELYLEEGRVIAYSDTEALITPKTEEAIKEALCKKAQLFSQYQKFQHNGIYIFAPVWFTLDDVGSIKGLDHSPFDFLIINAQDVIVFIKHTQVLSFEIPSVQLKAFKETAFQLCNR